MLGARQEVPMRTLSESALRGLFLGRLARLVLQLALVRSPEERGLVESALDSTYEDCRALGLRADAWRLMQLRGPGTGLRVTGCACGLYEVGT